MDYKAQLDSIYAEAEAHLDSFSGNTRNIFGMRDYMQLFGQVMETVATNVNALAPQFEKDYPDQGTQIKEYVQELQNKFISRHKPLKQ